MKTVGIISIVLFVISISTFASAYLLVKPSMTDDKTQEKCESVNENLKVGDVVCSKAVFSALPYERYDYGTSQFFDAYRK